MNRFSYNLLVVEDDANDRDEWIRQIERHNGAVEDTGGPMISLTTASSEAEAYEKISERRFDAAVIDLKLDGNGENPQDDGGNKVLAKILESEIAIAAIFTGQPQDAIVPDYATRQVRVITKGGGDGEGHLGAIRWLLENQSLVTCIRQVGMRFQASLASTFHQSVWPRWSLWMDGQDPNDTQFLLTAVARHLASHLHDQFLLDGNDDAHPEEWFWVPPRREQLGTGDMIRKGETIEILVTPRCDLATGKATNVQLVACDDLSQVWDGFGVGKKKDYIKNSRNNEHFIPKFSLSRTESIGPLIVRFDRVRSVELKAEDKLLTDVGERFAAIASPFLPSLVERLGNYYSRIGSPNYKENRAPVAG